MRIALLNVFKSLQSTNLKTMKEGIETLLIDDGNTLTNKPMVPMVHFQSTKQMAVFPMDKNDYPPLLHHQASHPSFTHESSHCACFKRREMTFSHPCAASKKGTSTLVPQVDIIFVKWKCQNMTNWSDWPPECAVWNSVNSHKNSAGIVSRMLMDTTRHVFLPGFLPEVQYYQPSPINYFVLTTYLWFGSKILRWYLNWGVMVGKFVSGHKMRRWNCGVNTHWKAPQKYPLQRCVQWLSG